MKSDTDAEADEENDDTDTDHQGKSNDEALEDGLPSIRKPRTCQDEKSVSDPKEKSEDGIDVQYRNK